MFQLNINILKENKNRNLNKIMMYFFTKNVDLNNLMMFNINFSVNYDIIPFITSILVKQPIFNNNKLYNCNDYNILITKLLNTSDYFIDLNTYNKFNTFKHNIIDTYISDNNLIILLEELLLSNFIKINDIINEIEYNNIKWIYEWGYFELIILNNKFNFILYINIIEDQNLIISRYKEINNIITKLNTIINHFYYQS